MKYLTTLLIASALAVSTAACAKEEPKAAAKAAPAASAPAPAPAAGKKDETEPKTKKVCIESKDSKGNAKTICRTMKIHEKHEGTKVPDGKK